MTTRLRNHRAIIDQYQEPTDPFATGKGEWIEVCREFVQLEPLSGRELLVAQQVQAQTTHKATLHFRGDINTAMRFRVAKPNVVDPDPANDSDWRVFHIESAINVGEMNRMLQLMLVEKV